MNGKGKIYNSKFKSNLAKSMSGRFGSLFSSRNNSKYI